MFPSVAWQYKGPILYFPQPLLRTLVMQGRVLDDVFAVYKFPAVLPLLPNMGDTMHTASTLWKTLMIFLEREHWSLTEQSFSAFNIASVLAE